MALKKCPFCAEEIQEAAILCKHCGQRFNQTNVNLNNITQFDSIIQTEENDKILAVVRYFAIPGRYSALIFTPDKLIIKPILSNAVLMTIGIISVFIVFIFFPYGLLSFLYLPIILKIHKMKVIDLEKQLYYNITNQNPTDKVILLSSIDRITVENMQKGWFPNKVTVSQASGQEVFFLDSDGVARLKQFLPTYITY